MKPRKSNPLNKPRFAIDINVGFNNLRQSYGGLATFTSVANLTKKQDTSDDEIIQICSKKNYHIITHNTKDFENAPLKFTNLNIGIICINLGEKNYLSKFGSYLRKFPKHENYCNKVIYLGNQIRSVTFAKLRSKI